MRFWTRWKANDREQAKYRHHWAKADAYVNTPEDYEELPELDDSFFERATMEINGKPGRGRPPKDRQHVEPAAQIAPRRGEPKAL